MNSNDETPCDLAAPANPEPAKVSPWVERFSSLIAPAGNVLDLACGSGRHARFLAERGYSVEAVDRDEAAVAKLQGVPGINARCADLEGGPWPYPGCRFAGVVVTNYLWRPLIPFLIAALDKGSILIYETFMLGNERFGKPSNPAFLLRKDELRHLIHKHLEVIAFEQGEISEPKQAVVQRLCAVRIGPLRLPR